MAKSPSILRPVPKVTPSKGPSRRALVLGAGGAAERIARKLKEEGFEPETSGVGLPALADPQALEKLREVLTRFAERAGLERAAGAPCLHPGVSVWAERPEIATLGEELGLDVICPSARVLALFGNKLNLLAEAERLGIPHLVTSFDPVHSAREIERLIYNQSLGRKPFPFVIKAVKGGGGFGVFVVQEPSDLERKIPLWVEQVRRNLGEVSFFSERYLESARHIVVPFVRHMDGRFKVFPMVDASLQSRYRKVVEICPATSVDVEMQKELADRARKLVDHLGYVGVGTLEFLVDATRAYLVESSARLNTGFHLWENVAGTSAVSWQLSALQGGGPGEEPECKQQAEWAVGLAFRLYAEDSLLQLPQPGEVREVTEQRKWSFNNPSLRAAAELDLLVSAGSRIESSGHGMLGMLWVGAEDRKQALNFARGVLDELWIAGSIQTNERFLGELLAHPWVREGIFHAGFADEEFLPGVRPPADYLRAFLMAAAYAAGDRTEPGTTVHWAVGDQWLKSGTETDASPRWIGMPDRWEHPGSHGVWNGASGRVQLPEGTELRVCAFPLSESKWLVRVGTWVLSVKRVSVPLGGRPKRAPRLLALVQGRVHAILHREGVLVPAHEPLLVLDSLGMLVPHAAPVDVRILRWTKSAEERVQSGEELAELEVVPKDG